MADTNIHLSFRQYFWCILPSHLGIVQYMHDKNIYMLRVNLLKTVNLH